jgi:hypothetical protein
MATESARLPRYLDDSDMSDPYNFDSDSGMDGFPCESDVSEKEDSTDEEDTSPDSAMQSHDSHQMKWSSGAGKSLRAYGSGSRTTEYRQKQRQATLQQEAASCYSIKALFKRQQDLKLSVKETPTSEAPEVSSLKDVERGKPRDPAAEAIARRDASKDLKRLIEFPSEQTKKYGHVLSQKSEFSRRHQLVLNFLWIQDQRQSFTKATRKELASIVAATHNRRGGTARRIMQWEKSWVGQRTIPQGNWGGKKWNVSWMNEEDILCAVRNFARSQGEGKQRVGKS